MERKCILLAILAVCLILASTFSFAEEKASSKGSPTLNLGDLPESFGWKNIVRNYSDYVARIENTGTGDALIGQADQTGAGIRAINTGTGPALYTQGKSTFTGQITSTLTTGAPFIINSQTLVGNLNADLLDGNHSSAFAPATHNHWGASWSGSGRGLYLGSSDNMGLWGNGASNYIGIAGSTTNHVYYNSSGTGVAAEGAGVGVFGSGGSFGLYGYADGSSYFGIRGHNANSSGTGLLSSGNGQTGWYLTNGSGVAGSGYSFGVFGRATNSGNSGQAGGYFDTQAGNYCYIAYRHTDGSNYKVIGSGSVSTVMPSSKGLVTLIAPESPEAWFEDFGSGELRNGFCHIELDPTFLECVTIDEQNPLRIFVQMTSSLPNGFYIKKGRTGFDVVEERGGLSTATFDYHIIARWKGWEGKRFLPGVGPQTSLEKPHETSEISE